MPKCTFTDESNVILPARKGRKPGSKNKPKFVSEFVSEQTITPITKDLGDPDIHSLEGYKSGARNFIYTMTTLDSGQIQGSMITDDPLMLYYFTGATQATILRTFLSRSSMLESIGVLGATFVKGIESNKVIILDNVRLH